MERLIPAGLFGSFTIIGMQSCFEWVYRQQLNLICLVFMFAILSYLDSQAPPLSSGKHHHARRKKMKPAMA